MHEHDAVAAFIERIVTGARIPNRAGREDLRRELWTHFEEAGASPEAVRHAMSRFGAEARVTESFRRVYRWDYRCLYLAKIAASIVVSLAAALLIQALASLRVELQAEAWRLAPGFSHAAELSTGVVLALVAAWEVGRPPVGRSRAVLRLQPAKLLLAFGVFACAQYGLHLVRSVAFGPGRAMLAGAVLAAVWSSTVVILARFDHVFFNVFETSNRG